MLNGILRKLQGMVIVYVLCLTHALAAPSFLTLTNADWQLLNRTPGIVTGVSQNPSIQMVFDPNCPASGRLHEYLYATYRDTTIRWVPVAYYRKDSLGKAAALLADSTPDQALHNNFLKYDYKTQSGAVKPIEPPLMLKERLQRLYSSKWLFGTPMIVVRSRDGRILANDQGNNPTNIDLIIQQAAGLQAYQP